jgi:hypothetical protein
MRRLNPPFLLLLASCGVLRTPEPHPLVGSWRLELDGLAGQLTHGPSSPQADVMRAHLARLQHRRPDHPDLAKFAVLEQATTGPFLTVTDQTIELRLGDHAAQAAWLPTDLEETTTIELIPASSPPETWTLRWLDEDRVWIEVGGSNLKLRLTRLDPA